MASENYQEHLAAERTERTRKMLQSLPLSCTDFITSIAMTTSPLTRLAYTIDLGTFCEFASREIPYYAEKSRQNGRMRISNISQDEICAPMPIT